MIEPEKFLHSLFDAGLEAVSARRCLPQYIPAPPTGRTVILAIGKGAAAMASVAASHYSGDYTGLIVTGYDHDLSKYSNLNSFEILLAGHPLPDKNGLNAAQRCMGLVENLTADDLLIALISGGGSSYLPAPIDGLTLAEKSAITAALMRSGATINEINCMRKHLSKIKGGRLAMLAAPARTVTLAVSDVAGDDMGAIASGPTVQDRSTLQDARSIAGKYQLPLPPEVSKALNDPNMESPDLSAISHPKSESHVIASSRLAINAARAVAEDANCHVIMLGDDIEGEARDIAAKHATIIKKQANEGRKTVILSGGELTVTLCENHGKGGANTEYLLALAIALDSKARIYAISCDTDGKDGSGEAGAIISPDTLNCAVKLGLNPDEFLQNNDSDGFFKALKDRIITGPTHTNVNDFRAIFIQS